MRCINQSQTALEEDRDGLAAVRSLPLPVFHPKQVIYTAKLSHLELSDSARSA